MGMGKAEQKASTFEVTIGRVTALVSNCWVYATLYGYKRKRLGKNTMTYVTPTFVGDFRLE